MNAKLDYNLLSEIILNANIGCWEADLQNANYICSEYISSLLGLKEDGVISFEDFNKRILKEEHPLLQFILLTTHNSRKRLYIYLIRSKALCGYVVKFVCRKQMKTGTARFMV